MKTYWTISDGTMLILEDSKPTRCELEGVELEPLDHASARRLVENVAARRFGSRFVLVQNDAARVVGGKVALWRYCGNAGFTLTAKPYAEGNYARFPSCRTATEDFGDLFFPVGGNDRTWFLFAVADGSAKTDGARQRLDDNLRSVFG